MSDTEDYPGPTHKQPGDTEDYPGPTHKQPDKEGQDPRGRADEDMVKPPARPESDVEKGSCRSMPSPDH
jgi:hypothetical protein